MWTKIPFPSIKKVKVSRDRPRWPTGFRVGYGPGYSWRFGTTRVVVRQPNAPAAFTPEEIAGTHFQRLSRPQSTLFCLGYHGKKSPVTPPEIDPGTFWLVVQCLRHFATPDPFPFPSIFQLNKFGLSPWCYVLFLSFDRVGRCAIKITAICPWV